MNSDVQKSVNAKTNYFDEYLIVPDGLRPEVNAFCAEVVALGEQCADFNAFEKYKEHFPQQTHARART